MTDDANLVPETPAAPPTLEPAARRVLGVLVEKAFCTPEYYPLTVNALVAGCNQKSNRDPVTSMDATDVENVLDELLTGRLVVRVIPASGRTERWKQVVKDAWQIDRPHRAVLAELLLRGPQTEGELRGRASRMVPIGSMEELHTVLEELASRGFVERISPDERKRGVIWAHRLYEPGEWSQLKTNLETEAGPTRPPLHRPEDGLAHRLERLERELEALRARVEELENRK